MGTFEYCVKPDGYFSKLCCNRVKVYSKHIPVGYVHLYLLKFSFVVVVIDGLVQFFLLLFEVFLCKLVWEDPALW